MDDVLDRYVYHITCTVLTWDDGEAGPRSGELSSKLVCYCFCFLPFGTMVMYDVNEIQIFFSTYSSLTTSLSGLIKLQVIDDDDIWVT